MSTKTLKQVLNENHKRKTKDELVELIQGIKGVVGDDYDKITGVQPGELAKTTNGDLVAIIEDFKENYDAKWESNASAMPAEILGFISDRMKADDTLFSASNAANADFAAELGGMDFEKLIGGPLNACVTAQSNASLATVNFVQNLGFVTTGTGASKTSKVRMVDFSHTKKVANPHLGKSEDDLTEEGLPDATDTTSTQIDEEVTLVVPFISLMNIPSLRIEKCTIDFNCKLNSVYTKDVSDELGIEAGASGGWGPVKFNVSASYKRSSSTGVKVEKEYSMGVNVVATNDEMPAGLERVLGILAA